MWVSHRSLPCASQRTRARSRVFPHSSQLIWVYISLMSTVPLSAASYLRRLSISSMGRRGNDGSANAQAACDKCSLAGCLTCLKSEKQAKRTLAPFSTSSGACRIVEGARIGLPALGPEEFENGAKVRFACFSLLRQV